jgi:hypothetical protein
MNLSYIIIIILQFDSSIVVFYFQIIVFYHFQNKTLRLENVWINNLIMLRLANDWVINLVGESLLF